MKIKSFPIVRYQSYNRSLGYFAGVKQKLAPLLTLFFIYKKNDQSKSNHSLINPYLISPTKYDNTNIINKRRFIE